MATSFSWLVSLENVSIVRTSSFFVLTFQEKVDYGALIQELGGEYIDQDYFTSKCTHLVVGESDRNYLNLIASPFTVHK